jgi:hypothetical protein
MAFFGGAWELRKVLHHPVVGAVPKIAPQIHPHTPFVNQRRGIVLQCSMISFMIGFTP